MKTIVPKILVLDALYLFNKALKIDKYTYNTTYLLFVDHSP